MSKTSVACSSLMSALDGARLLLSAVETMEEGGGGGGLGSDMGVRCVAAPRARARATMVCSDMVGAQTMSKDAGNRVAQRHGVVRAAPILMGQGRSFSGPKDW